MNWIAIVSVAVLFVLALFLIAGVAALILSGDISEGERRCDKKLPWGHC